MSASETAPADANDLCPRCRMEWLLHDVLTDGSVFCLDGGQAPDTGESPS